MPHDLPFVAHGDLTLRPAESSDIPWLARLWATAFPGERTSKQRARELEAGSGRFGGLSTCWVGEEGGEPVGALRSYSLSLSLWGAEFPTQGLAAVAVAPEHRRRGVGARLCAAGLQVGRAMGKELSLLYPFRVDFYRRLGYTLAGTLHRYVTTPREIPLFPEGRRARVLDPESAGRSLPPFYEAVRPDFQGLLRRDHGLWRFLEPEGKEPPLVVAVPEGEPPAGSPDASGPGTPGVFPPGAPGASRNGSSQEALIRGYLVATPDASPVAERRTLRVRELVAADLEAYRTLLGWIALQRGIWERVILDALPGEHLDQILKHPRRAGSRTARDGGLWFSTATILRGPMLRILALDALLDRLGISPVARGALQVDDPDLPENSTQGSSEPGALSVALASELFLDGALPGQAEAVESRGWRPRMGLADFRLLDTF